MPDQGITRKSDQIAILGWGSLLWDGQNNRYFDVLHGPWMFDGPELKLEFSRKSQTRSGALTLVIDPKHGASSRVAYAISTRVEPQAAVNDLRRREGTSNENIGRFFGDDSPLNRGKSAGALGVIGAWAKEKGFDVVLWTDLGGDFDAIEPGLFVPAAIKYCESLTSDGRSKAVEYVSRAPNFVQTPFKDALEREPWFREKVQLMQGSNAERRKSE